MAEINDCSKCGTWALQALTPVSHLYYCHCFNGDCGNEGPVDPDSNKSIERWNAENPRLPRTDIEK